MPFTTQTVKGLTRYLQDTDLDPKALRMHLSEIAPGTNAHPPHSHAGAEAFYVLEGHGTLKVGEESYPLGPNEALLLDPTKTHGLTNTGDTPMRYLVIIVPG
ncbi:MAG: cupin domain-containing protein [Anaerolineae bacterium]|nr:cupin domain-containing protein [Anaerolineae bacterium]